MCTCSDGSLWKANCPLMASHMIMPSAQTSPALVRRPSSRSSGAACDTVPKLQGGKEKHSRKLARPHLCANKAESASAAAPAGPLPHFSVVTCVPWSTSTRANPKSEICSQFQGWRLQSGTLRCHGRLNDTCSHPLTLHVYPRRSRCSLFISTASRPAQGRLSR